MYERQPSVPPTRAPLVVVAGGSSGTGTLVALLARDQGRAVRVVDVPEQAHGLRAAIAGAAGVVLVPARGTGSVAAQAGSVVDACTSVGPSAPHVVLVTGFSVGHGRAHALNTPDRLADLVAAEELVRGSGCPYTIARPTWLTDDPRGRYALVLTQDPMTDGMVARADLASVCLAAIDEPQARGKTFAVLAQPGAAPTRWAAMFASLVADNRLGR
jgi:uncharacterized protein YbjT (DUF2867 family)